MIDDNICCSTAVTSVDPLQAVRQTSFSAKSTASHGPTILLSTRTFNSPVVKPRSSTARHAVHTKCIESVRWGMHVGFSTNDRWAPRRQLQGRLANRRFTTSELAPKLTIKQNSASHGVGDVGITREPSRRRCAPASRWGKSLAFPTPLRCWRVTYVCMAMRADGTVVALHCPMRLAASVPAAICRRWYGIQRLRFPNYCA